MRVAVDVGGTFTDVLCYDEHTGSLVAAKVPSDSSHPAKPFIRAIEKALSGVQPALEDVELVVHGTTIVTNSILEGKMSRVGLLVTEGFRDVLEIGRQQRPSLYDLFADRPDPIVPRELVREVRERVSSDGEVLVPLDLSGARHQIEWLSNAGIEALAIVLLFSFRNPNHEAQIGELARELLPQGSVYLSSELLPEFREYERASTTAIAAAVAPGTITYLQDIQQRLAENDCPPEALTIMHSGGGTVPAQEAMKHPHTLIESGPAAGLIAAAHLAQRLGLGRAIAFDMGGTTAKAGILLDGSPQYASECEVGGDIHQTGEGARGGGYPVRFPMIDLAECGSGAGSIAWIDRGGHLKVGPQSAGADPGPACYGRGGTEPTVTDAHLVLGHLAPDAFLGGEMTLHPVHSERAIETRIAGPMGITLEDAAKGVLTIADANMQRVLRLVSIARGHDPRLFTMIAYGGAGPLHAVDQAEAMSIDRIIVPPFPGLFTSLGLLCTDTTREFVETVMETLIPDRLHLISESLTRLGERAETWLEHIESPPEVRVYKASADLRYLGQNYELNVQMPGTTLSPEGLQRVQDAFHDTHQMEYGHGTPGETIQVVNLRVLAVWRLAKPELHPIPAASGPADTALQAMQTVWFSAGPESVPIYERSGLKAGHAFEGPAVIRETESTTLVKPGWHTTVDELGNLVMTRP